MRCEYCVEREGRARFDCLACGGTGFDHCCSGDRALGPMQDGIRIVPKPKRKKARPLIERGARE